MADRVVGRFFVQTLARQAYGSGWAEPAPKGPVHLQVCSRGPENKEWASATPSGSIDMVLNNGSAWQFFEEAMDEECDVEVTFRKVPKAQ